MDCVELWYDDEESLNERIQRRVLRDQNNVLALSEKSFVKNFRLSKDAFVYVLNEISPALKSSSRSTAVTPMCKLAAALKFLAQGGYQHQIGQDVFVGLAQQTMSNCLHEVCCAIERTLCPKRIKFEMSEQEESEAKRFFYRKCGIPGVIGAVDGTHIQMVRPSVNDHLYFNRKLKHSMNVMVICDHNMFIRAVNARFGGSSHDSHVWQLSSERQALKARFDNGERGTCILGDSGYPLEPWLLTPYRNPNEHSPEAVFNDNFSKGRSLIERVFGVLKGRFRCLLSARELHYNPNKVVRIMNVCCALHNICQIYNVERPPEIFEEDDNEPNPHADIPYHVISQARNMRDQIRDSML